MLAGYPNSRLAQLTASTKGFTEGKVAFQRGLQEVFAGGFGAAGGFVGAMPEHVAHRGLARGRQERFARAADTHQHPVYLVRQTRRRGLTAPRQILKNHQAHAYRAFSRAEILAESYFHANLPISIYESAPFRIVS